ncbi:MAG: alpha/beta fold hydrolase [Bacteroidota bacterium]
MHALLNGANIHYVEAGPHSAPPVIFLHGFPFSHAMWHPQIEAVAAAGYRVVAFDFRGHGNSDVGDGQYTIEGHVDDLFALLDHLRIPRVVVVGLSMGGYVALRALEREQERFIAAVLCDTRSEADPSEGRIKRAAGMKAVKSTGSAAYADDFVKAVFAKETFAGNPGAVARIRDIISHTPPLSIAGTLLALAARTDTTASLASIAIPALILVGEHDVTTPPAASQAMHEKIPTSELHIIPGAAHMSNLENPSTFNEKLLTFLQRAAPPR